MRAAKHSELKRYNKYTKRIITWSSVNYLRRRKREHSRDQLHIKINDNTFVDSFFFRFDLFLSHFISLQSVFLSSKPFWNSRMHCEIIDRYFNVFFAEIQPKKENLKSVFWAAKPVYRSPKQPEYITATLITQTWCPYLKW